MKEFKKVAVPSEFCKRVLSKQFPENEFYIITLTFQNLEKNHIHSIILGTLWIPERKFQDILQAFIRLNETNTRSDCQSDM